MSEPPKASVQVVGPAAGAASLFDDVDESSTVIDDGLFGEQESDVPNYPAVAMLGRFEILGRIAMGGMAEVFLARERGVHGGARHVVIKRVLPHIADDEDFIRMFLDEARISTRLYHPNVCHLYEAGKIDGAYFMAMEWVFGTPLRRVVRRARELGGIPSPIACHIIAKVAEALHYSHTACDAEGSPLGIVHRDVSPHNVMIRWDGAVKLLDFGIAKAAHQDVSTDAGVVKGKYSYLSPEQCHGKDVDHRGDIFALGICLFECVTGKPLYHRGSVLNTMTAIAKEAVPSIRAVNPELSGELDRIVQRALAKHPNQRFQTAQDMARALYGYLDLAEEIVHPPRVAAFLDQIFPASERTPIPEDTLRQTGSFPQLTPSTGLTAQSGSFGPFGQQAPRPDAIRGLDVDVVIDGVPVAFDALPSLSLEDLRATRRPRWLLWTGVAFGAALVAGIVATVIVLYAL